MQMKKVISFMYLALASLSLLAQNQTKFDKMVDGLYSYTVPLIKPTKLNELINKGASVILLDAREKEEFEVSRIKEAIYVGYDYFEISSVKGLDKNANIIIYCSVGYRSEKIGEKLKKAGFTNVLNLYGGVFDWTNNGFDMVDKNGEVTEKIHPYNSSWGKWLTKGEKTYE